VLGGKRCTFANVMNIDDLMNLFLDWLDEEDDLTNQPTNTNTNTKGEIR